jgi:hypothetical protein
MRFNKEEVSSIAGENLINDKIAGNPDFNWIDVVGIPKRPVELEANLYLTSHSRGEGGWSDPFDRREIVPGVARDKETWYLAIEPGLEIAGAEYLRVESLDHLAEQLYRAAQERSNPFVVGVTGSVGKTTSVAFMEHLLAEDNRKVSRFYSKRLTPASVMCHYINTVQEDTSFIVMEYSAYMDHHVEELSRLLPPNIAFLNNIYDTHVGEGAFNSKKDVFNSKTRIKADKTHSLVNSRVCAELEVPVPSGWGTFDVELPKGMSNPFLPPTLRTAELYTVGRLLANEVGIPEAVFNRAYESFEPTEKRIILCHREGKPVYFHGETSGGSRLWSWFETFDGSVPYLFVEEINFADEDPEGFVKLLEPVFDSPKTFVLDSPANRERLPVSANFLPKIAFIDEFDRFRGYTIYHKALATRVPGFDPQDYLESL